MADLPAILGPAISSWVFRSDTSHDPSQGWKEAISGLWKRPISCSMNTSFVGICALSLLQKQKIKPNKHFFLKKNNPKRTKATIYRLIPLQHRSLAAKAQNKTFTVVLVWFDNLSRTSHVFLSVKTACGKVICVFCLFQNSSHRSL